MEPGQEPEGDRNRDRDKENGRAASQRCQAAQHPLQGLNNAEEYSGPGCAWAELSMRTRLCTVCRA